MRTSQFDWTIVAVVLVLLVLAGNIFPFSLTSLILGGVGIWVLIGAVRAATGGDPLGKGKVTYWRGQRMEIKPVGSSRRFDFTRVWTRVLFGGVLVFAAALPYIPGLPWYVAAVLVACIGLYFVWSGWQAWSGGASTREAKYWRGQRIEPTRRGFSLPPLKRVGPAIIPLLLGIAILVGVATFAVERLQYGLY